MIAMPHLPRVDNGSRSGRLQSHLQRIFVAIGGENVLARMIADTPVDRERQEREMTSLEPARHRYAILFIPRSGSTWLAGLLMRQKLYGKPREHFEAENIRRSAPEMNANTLADLFAMLLRKASVDGVFGTKIACQSLEVLLREIAFEEVFAGYRWLYLRRRNLVAQAVSHYKAVATGHSHRRKSHTAELRREMDEADARLPYDADAIAKSMQEAIDMEHFAERIIAEHRLAPLRIYYEDVIAGDPLDTVAAVHRLLYGAEPVSRKLLPSPVERSATAINLDFEERFRRDRADVLRESESSRPPLL
jgi:LPS sulfotransferase NodH